MEQEPVTVVVRHRVRPGREAEFEEWLRGISRAALQFDGNPVFNVIRPADPKRPEYLVLFRFDSLAQLEVWENSDERRAWLDRVEPLVVHPPERERHTGLEVWFTPPAGRPGPPRYKMVPVTLLAIYPLLLIAQMTLVPLLADWPLPLRALVTSATLVCLMTYAAMPLATRLFTRWLYGPR